MTEEMGKGTEKPEAKDKPVEEQCSRCASTGRVCRRPEDPGCYTFEPDTRRTVIAQRPTAG